MITAHAPLFRFRRRTIPGPFAVLEGPDGDNAEKLQGLGLQAFRFMANGQTVERIGRGYYADKFYHVPLTVWAFNADAAAVEARRQIVAICPGVNWAVLPA